MRQAPNPLTPTLSPEAGERGPNRAAACYIISPPHRAVAMSALLLFALAAPADDWPRFRGPNGQGVAATAAPAEWGEAKNVRWSADVPAAGWSSPVVGGGRVVVTGTTDGGTRCHVLAFAADTGKPLWDRDVFAQEPTRKEGKNSFATPTPVLAGDAVFAVFGQGGIAALNAADGSVRWTFTGVSHYSQHGLGASPVVWKNLLVMAYDGSSPGPDKKVGWQTPWDGAVLLALDTATGKEVWRAKRGPSRIGHSTPILATVSGREVLVSQGGDVVQGFDPATGERLWSWKNPGEGLVPSPVLVGDRLVTTPGWPTPAVRAWDFGADKPAWERAKNVPMLPSLVAVGGRLFALSEKGILTCLDPATGEPKWEERLAGSFSASLVSAGGKVYALSESGECTVFDAADTFNMVSRNKLPGVFQATPAVSGGRLLLRSDKRVWCVGP